MSLWTAIGPPARILEAVLKLIGLFLFGVVLYAAWWGNTNFAVNISGDAFLIWFWVGLQFVSALFGDVWRAFNPYFTIADVAAWVKSRVTQSEMSPIDHGESTLWPAAIAIFAYLWFELAYNSLWFESEVRSAAAPRAIAVFLTVYSVVMLVGAAYNGRGWVRTADGFAVLFSKLGGDGRLPLRRGASAPGSSAARRARDAAPRGGHGPVHHRGARQHDLRRVHPQLALVRHRR